MDVNSEPGAAYNVDTSNDDVIIAQALAIAKRRMMHGDCLSDPRATRDYLSLHIGMREHEVFAVIFLDNRNRVICHENMFRGTIDGAAVYVREVAKAALTNNAASVILAHNHPSGEAEPSSADRDITRRLKDGLGLLDIRVLDHIIVAGANQTSMAERGMI